MYSFVSGAIIKYHRLGGLYNTTETYFLTVPEVRSPSSSCQQIWLLLRPLSGFKWPFLCVSPWRLSPFLTKTPVGLVPGPPEQPHGGPISRYSHILKYQVRTSTFKFSGVCNREDKIHPLKTGLSEQRPKEANLLFFFILDFDDSMFVKTSTAKEWIAQGDYYAKHQCWKVRSWASRLGKSW